MGDSRVGSSDRQTHLRHLEAFFNALATNGLAINLEKCVFAAPSLEILGHTISATGAAPTANHATEIKKLPAPQDIKQLQRFPTAGRRRNHRHRHRRHRRHYQRNEVGLLQDFEDDSDLLLSPLSCPATPPLIAPSSPTVPTKPSPVSLLSTPPAPLEVELDSPLPDTPAWPTMPASPPARAVSATRAIPATPPLPTQPAPPPAPAPSKQTPSPSPPSLLLLSPPPERKPHQEGWELCLHC
jgi:hypothetical protein